MFYIIQSNRECVYLLSTKMVPTTTTRLIRNKTFCHPSASVLLTRNAPHWGALAHASISCACGQSTLGHTRAYYHTESTQLSLRAISVWLVSLLRIQLLRSGIFACSRLLQKVMKIFTLEIPFT